MLKYVIAILLGAGLLACSAVTTITVDTESIAVTEEYNSLNSVDSIVGPYKTQMEQKMNEVISFSMNDFTKGRPGGSLNNWAADAILNQELKRTPAPGPVFCLLNVGGLRNPIGKGDVTLEDIYKLMPFDNLVVWVEMPLSSILDIESYIQKKGGEPIAGAKMEGGKLKVEGVSANTKSYWVVTSDYLMNGGDKMTFFEKRLSERYSNVLMRDAMIAEARDQDTLIWNDESRIEF